MFTRKVLVAVHYFTGTFIMELSEFGRTDEMNHHLVSKHETLAK